MYPLDPRVTSIQPSVAAMLRLLSTYLKVDPDSMTHHKDRTFLKSLNFHGSA